MPAISWQRVLHSLLFVCFLRMPVFFFLNFHYLSSPFAPTKTARESQFPFLHWIYPQVQKNSNPGVFYSTFHLHWLAAHRISRLLRSWLNPCGASQELHCQAPSLEANPSQEPCPRRRMCLLAPLFHTHRAVRCIRAAFARRHSVKGALKWIESRSTLIMVTQQCRWRRSLKWLIIMKQWSEIFWMEALFLWKV